MLSIVIPTLNEEKYLPKLLSSIKKQNFKQKYEVIVADANSKDSTRDIANRYGCRIVKGGNHAVGKNNGARAAKGDILLIIDADAVMPKKFLTKNFQEFTKKNLDVASCYIKPIDGKFIDKITHIIFNSFCFSFKKINPVVPSLCFFVKKNFFFKIGGFDEKVPWFVDLDFANKLPKDTRYDILPVNVNVSVRMAERLGRFRQARIFFLLGLLRIIKRNYYGSYNLKERK
ncbi:glycosyltransferase [Candidatus Woesearchaeota archaeon]|nr:glycosyltransferase [Candidatus Woesearchaeota archaeon]